MKDFVVVTGNRFHEVENHLVSLGLTYINGCKWVDNIEASDITYTASNMSLSWGSYFIAIDPNLEQLSIQEVLGLTKEDFFPVKDNQEYKFHPFENVIVAKNQIWTADFFSHYEYEREPCSMTKALIGKREILPYKGNEDKLGTLWNTKK